MIDRVTLITGNPGKAREYSTILGIEVTATRLDLVEIQSLDVATVVERKATDAYAKLHRPVLVDDTGLALDAWNGLPGALVAWFLDTVGTQGHDRSRLCRRDRRPGLHRHRSRDTDHRASRQRRLRLRHHLRTQRQHPDLRGNAERGEERDLKPAPGGRRPPRENKVTGAPQVTPIGSKRMVRPRLLACLIMRRMARSGSRLAK